MKSSLEVGEKYLSCRMKTYKALEYVLTAISKGEDSISFSIFKNKDKTANNQPSFTSNGLAVWIQQKKEQKKIDPLQEAIEEMSL